MSAACELRACDEYQWYYVERLRHGIRRFISFLLRLARVCIVRNTGAKVSPCTIPNAIKSQKKMHRNGIRSFDVSMNPTTYSCHFTSYRAPDRAQNCCCSSQAKTIHFPRGNNANAALCLKFDGAQPNTVAPFSPTIIICNFSPISIMARDRLSHVSANLILTKWEIRRKWVKDNARVANVKINWYDCVCVRACVYRVKESISLPSPTHSQYIDGTVSAHTCAVCSRAVATK